MFSLESPHRGDSNEITRYTIFNIRKKFSLNYPKSATIGTGLNLERIRNSVVNEPSMFKSLKVYSYIKLGKLQNTNFHCKTRGWMDGCLNYL